MNEPVCIVGAGISGLTLAHRLQQLRQDVVVLEAGDRAGGKMETQTRHGVQFEAGPNTLLLNRQPTIDLLGELGLLGELIDASALAKRRWVYKDQRLIAVPSSPLGALSSPLLGVAGLRQAAGDLFCRRPDPQHVAGEETVASFTQRHFGPRVLRNLVEPFITGIYAGDVDRMEAGCVLPSLVAAEKRSGSVIRGLMARARDSRRAGKPKLKMRSVTLRQGLESLPRALAASLGPRLLLNAKVASVQLSPGSGAVDQAGRPGRTNGGVVVRLVDGRIISARQLVLACDAPAAAEILSTDPAGRVAAGWLGEIEMVPMAVVGLVYERSQVAHPLDGFGFLCARPNELSILGCIFRSSIFPHTVAEGHVLLVTFLGGAHDVAVASNSPAVLIGRAERDLCAILSITGKPAENFARIWPAALPHPVGGQMCRRQNLSEWSVRQSVWFLGPAVHGPGLNDCIAAAGMLAERLSVERPIESA